MESRAWLVRRAVLAIGLMIGFYLLAIAIAVGLLWIPYAEWKYVGRIHLKLTLGAVISGLTVLWAIVPRVDKFDPPGPQLDRASAPKLFAMIDEVAGKTKQEPPSEVYIVNEVNAWVTQRGGAMGFGGRRVMGIGVPLLQGLSQREVKAIVGHEFGHYAAGDVSLGPWIYKTRAAIGRALQGVHGTLLEKPFDWYGHMFLKLTHSVSRQQEFVADRIGADVGGVSSMASALRRVEALATAFAKFHYGELLPVLRAGFIPPVAAGFADYLRLTAAEPTNEPTESAVEQTANEYDTHPPLHERLAALATLDARRVSDPSADAPALELLPDLEKHTTALFAFLSAKAGEPLKPIAWDAVAKQVYLPQFRQNVQSLAKWLSQFTVDALPAGKAAWAKVGSQLLDGDEYYLEEDARVARAVQGAGIGLTVLLLDHEWHLTTGLGQPISLEKSGVRIEPFQTMADLVDGKMDHAEWKARCSVYGIAGQKLGPRQAAGANVAT